MTRIITNDEPEEHLSITDCLSSLETMFEEMGHERAITAPDPTTPDQSQIGWN